jgi:hypothetical protein
MSEGKSAFCSRRWGFLAQKANIPRTLSPCTSVAIVENDKFGNFKLYLDPCLSIYGGI